VGQNVGKKLADIFEDRAALFDGADPNVSTDLRITTITPAQALFLMNNSFVAERTSLEHNKTLATIADAAKTDTARRIETLFLVVLTRKPTAAERNRFVAYVDGHGQNDDRRRALADVFWVLLNCAEFRLNH